MADPHINPSTGVWDDNYYAQSQSQNKSSGGDIASIAQQQMQLYQQANQPAIQSLQSSLPEISNKFAQERQQLQAEQQPLVQRYQSLLGQITNNQAAAEKRTGLATSAELGRRGISNSSGLYDQTVNQAINPITQQYTSMYKDTGLQQESDLRNLQNQIANLTPAEIEAQRQVQNAIAQLQAGGNSSAIQNALAIYNQQQEAARQAQQQALQQPLLDLQAKLASQNLSTQQQLDPIQIASARMQLNKSQQPAGDNGIADLIRMFNPNGNVAGATKEAKPSVYGMSTNSGPIYYSQ